MAHPIAARDDLVLNPLADGDGEELCELFRAAYGRERSAEEQRWRFEQVPGGGLGQVARVAGRAVAFFGALPMAARLGGEPVLVAQGVDSMVHPEHRAGLRRPGLLVRTAERFFERHGGAGAEDRPVAFFFGWPVLENQRIGARLLGYERAGAQPALVRPVGQGAGDAPLRGVHELAGFDGRVERLVQRCSRSFGLVGERDARWLTWRYRARPGLRYGTLAVDAGGSGSDELAALALTRVLEWSGHRVLALCEWWAEPDARAAAELLDRALEAAARRTRAEAVLLWLPPWSPWFPWFQGRGYRVRRSPHELVVRGFDRRADLELARDGWWYGLGDSDLV